MKYHSGILDGRPKWDAHSITILALTPGIPIEWVIHAGKLNMVRRAELKRLVRTAQIHPFVIEKNQASITQDDAFTMLEVTPANYRGAIPLYAQLWLQSTPLTDKEVGQIIGRPRTTVAEWRTAIHFDPLTGVRIR